MLDTTLKESPRVVEEGITVINSSKNLLRLQTACLTAPESSVVFLLLCAPSMLLAVACYRGELKRWATLGEHGTLPEKEVQDFDGNVAVDLWALFP
jgi:hypothetical protein